MFSDTVNYKGEPYILLQNAYIEGHQNDQYYTAVALDSKGHKYQIYWEIFEDFLEDMAKSADLDESYLCDWKNPSSVTKL